MADVTINADLIRGIVDTHIQLAIAQALGKDPEKLIEKVVAHALAEKKDSYSRETKVAGLINSMIQNAAKESFQAWLEENKPKIAAAIDKRLRKSPQRFVDDIAEQLVKSLSTNVRIVAFIDSDKN